MNQQSFNEKDCLVSSYSNGSPEVKMTVVHLPTGLSVSKEGRRSNKIQENLMAELKNKWEAKYLPKGIVNARVPATFGPCFLPE